MIVSIPLTRGIVAIIDEIDSPLVSHLKWHAVPATGARGKFYAVHGRGGNEPSRFGRQYMHRMILGEREGCYVDHINGNGLDNRRQNLRFATPSQNSVNTARKVGASGFRGVYPSRGGKWEIRLRANRSQIYGGTFDKIEDAARAYDALALLHHGEFAMLNFARQSA